MFRTATPRAGCSACTSSSPTSPQRKLSERAIAESEARFRAIANSAPVPMWVTGSDGRREFVNQAYLDFLGAHLRGGARIRLAEARSIPTICRAYSARNRSSEGR